VTKKKTYEQVGSWVILNTQSEWANILAMNDQNLEAQDYQNWWLLNAVLRLANDNYLAVF